MDMLTFQRNSFNKLLPFWKNLFCPFAWTRFSWLLLNQPLAQKSGDRLVATLPSGSMEMYWSSQECGLPATILSLIALLGPTWPYLSPASYFACIIEVFERQFFC